jgi:hypothetical protein
MIVPGDRATFYRSRVAGRFYEAGFRVLDPLRAKGKKIAQGAYRPGEIIQRDVQDVLACKEAGFIFAVLLKSTLSKKVSIGTPSELAIAWFNHIPIVFVTDDEILVEHLWIRAMCGRTFLIKDVEQEGAFDEAVEYSINWYGPTSERWALPGVVVTNAG